MDFNLLVYFNAFDADKDHTGSLGSVELQLETVTETLANNPEAIHLNGDVLEEMLDLMHGYKSLATKHQKQLAYLVTSSLNSVAHACLVSLESGDYTDGVEGMKRSLERLGYLMYVLLIFLGKEDYTASKNSRNVTQLTASWKANCTQVENCLDAVVNVLKVELHKIFVTTPERDLYLDIYIRPIFHLMEIPERMKQAAIKMYMFRAVSMAVRLHGQSGSVQNLILQSLTYYVHLPPYMAELLHVLATQYDYTVLTEEVLREISQIEFNSNDNNGPKSIAEFLIKLSELSSRLILKQMALVALLLDNSNMTLRCSVVEACGNVVVDIIKSEAQLEKSEDLTTHSGHNTGGHTQVDSLIELLEERFLDQNPYVRTKAIQAMTKLCNIPDQFTQRRQNMIALAVRSLNDRSTLVRRNSIKLLSKVVLTHPFLSVHGTQLNSEVWAKRLKETEDELLRMVPNEEAGGDIMEEDEDSDAMEEDAVDAADPEGVPNPVPNVLALLTPDQVNAFYKLQLTKKYYQDALAFIAQVEEGVALTSQLLFSKNRNEVLESMDFLVLADAYNVDGSSQGIRKMLHLVWMKGSSDEGKSISTHLIDCYHTLFFTAPTNISRVQQAAFIAKNLIGLTRAASMADLALLEKLLCLMYNHGLIAGDVIMVLWQIYKWDTSESGPHHEDAVAQRRGAVIILGMLALADNEIIVKGLDALLNVGLGDAGYEDLVLAKYTCVAIQRIVPPGGTGFLVRIAREQETITKLKVALLTYTDNTEWYSIAEQAIGAIYRISSKPDEISTEVIKEKTAHVFADDTAGESKVAALSQLLFIVGHIAIKTVVYLESLEAEFKKKKHDAESNKGKNEGEGEDANEEGELEMIGGTSEDDFTDAVIYIKERQLLYGEDALLSKFGPMVKEICSNNKIYDSQLLQRLAVLCLAKMMCVLSKYCEENLPLLITIMEKSPDPVIRCNCVLGLGDMAVCFNNLVDENTDFLYRRLADENIMVQRTCLMTVTFLILAGQVKVKGQLLSMAKCLENPDQGISDMCRLFFTELATKDNAIYNGFIDIFSGLSNDVSLSKDSMKRIVKFLVGFIEKEKHQKQLAEKLLVRLCKSQSETQWSDLAYVLNVIPYKSEAITQALEGGYKLVSARQ